MIKLTMRNLAGLGLVKSWHCQNLFSLKVAFPPFAGLILIIMLSGCSTALGTAGIVLAGIYGSIYTALGLGTPDNEMAQVYYLGTFDPHGQIPPSIYRISVRGQSPLLSQMKFASGWVPAPLVDPLGSSLEFSKDASGNNVILRGAETKSDVKGLYGRKLVLFGPEGFREAPQDQRLVIVMGSDPTAFFKAFDQAQGEIISTLSKRITQPLSEISNAKQ